MEQSKLFKKFPTQSLLAILLSFGTLILADEIIEPTVVTLNASEEFTFIDNTSTSFTIKPLQAAHRSIETLANVDALGIIYLGDIVLINEATPLSALRDISSQISKSLNLDLALITDSTTSKSLEPHELLLLYHPYLTITLALTKTEADNQYALIGTYSMPSRSDKVVSDKAAETSLTE